MKILIVEDFAYKLRTVQNILDKKEHIKYDVAKCAVEAFKKIQTTQYDLIILDLGFCRDENDIYERTYDAKQGLILFQAIQVEYRHHKENMPDVIIYSETELKPEEDDDEIWAKASNEFQLMEIFEQWYKTKRKKRILVVEDEPYKRNSVHDVLAQFKNVEVYDATFAEQAIAICKNESNIDVLILDMGFPWKKEEKPEGKNGIKMVEKIKEVCSDKNKKMPKIVVYSITPFERLMLNQGFEIPKEFSGQTCYKAGLEELLKAII